jgi:hypothetical protein
MLKLILICMQHCIVMTMSPSAQKYFLIIKTIIVIKCPVQKTAAAGHKEGEFTEDVTLVEG